MTHYCTGYNQLLQNRVNYMGAMIITYDIVIAVQGDSSFTPRTINPIRKLVKIMGLHSLHIRLQMCAINFPISFHSEP
jgi:hypothetical protein